MAAPTWTLPPSVLDVFNHFRTGEFATFTQAGQLSVVPVSPLWDEERQTLVITTATGLALKAYHVHRNPIVSILLSEPFASGLTNPPTVLVQGSATVSEDFTGKRLAKFGRIIGEKVAGVNYRTSPIMRRLMDWYYVRLLIDIVPERMIIWENGDWHQTPTVLGSPLPLYAEPPQVHDTAPPQWQRRLPALVRAYPTGVVTVPGPDGYPFSFRTPVTVPPSTHALTIPAIPPSLAASNVPAALDGSLLFHTYAADMKLNHMRQYQVRGRVTVQDQAATLTPTHFFPGLGSHVTDHPVGLERLSARIAYIRSGKRQAKIYAQKRTFRQATEVTGE